MSKTLYPLPDVTDPPETLCVQIDIPNEPGHRQAFLGAVYNLTRWYSWKRDPAKRAKLVAEVWARVYDAMLEHFYDGCGDEEMFDIRVTGCVIEKTTDGGETWIPVVDIEECATGEPGQTPEFRMRTVVLGQKAIEWKYTDEPETPGIWRLVGYVYDGEDGVNAGEQVWRLRVESATRRVLQWRFEDEPDLPGVWRTVGSWDIPVDATGDCDCEAVAAPTDVDANPNRCDTAYGIAKRASEEVIAEVQNYDDSVAWPAIAARTSFQTLNFLRNQGLPLTLWTAINAYMLTYWASIDDSTEAGTFKTELSNGGNIDDLAEIIWSVYNPTFQFTSTHAALIGAAAQATYPLNRAIMAMAKYIQITPPERWQEAAITGMTQDAGQDCTAFAAVAGAVTKQVNFVNPTGSIYETIATYSTLVRLSLVSGVLAAPLRVYYEAEDLSAVNEQDYILPFGYVTFPAGANNGSTLPIAFSILDNEEADGQRQFKINLMETDGDTIIGSDSSHLVTIKDNEDFYLIIGNGWGTNLVRVGEWTWEATSTQQGSFQRLSLMSMNFDMNRCYKVVNFQILNGNINDYYYVSCGGGGGTGTQVPSHVRIWDYQLAYTIGSPAPPFTVRIEIDPS